MEQPAAPTEGTHLRFFTSQEVAEILKMHPQVITRKLQAGDLPGYKLGKDWRISESQLLEFLEQHSNKHGALTESERTVGVFFENDKLKSIPVSRTKRLAVLRHLVAKLDPQKVYDESEVNQFLSIYHPDVCTLRREFIMNKLMVRKNGKYKVSTATPRS